MNADEDNATGTVNLVVKTFNDLDLVEKFFQLKYESETTNKLLTNSIRFARMEILRNLKTHSIILDYEFFLHRYNESYTSITI